MGRKKNKNIDKPKAVVKEEREPSFFDGIVLKEKKEDKKPKPQQKKKPAATSGKKPGEIVHGYNPSVSFADILYSFEKTGNPYSMPKPKASREGKKEDFGDILDKWEGKGKSKAQRRVESTKNTYTPTKSFAEILSSYESSGQSVQSKKKQDRTRVSDILVEGEDDEKEEETMVEKKASKSPERKSKKYEPKSDFASILDQFEGKSDGKKVEKSEPDKPKKIEKEVVIEKEEIETTSFFKKEDDENQIASGVTWSILGGAQERARKEEEEVPQKEEPKESVRVSPKYEPKMDFASILDQFEGKSEAPHVDEDQIIKELQKKLGENADVEETSDLFRKEDEDNKVEKNVAWSIMGGRNESFVRSERNVDDNAPEHQEYVKSNSSYKKQDSFSSIFSSFEKKEEEKSQEVVKTFEEILAEKGDLLQQKPVYTMTKLRTMLPQATLDLHGETQAEAERSIIDFLNEAVESGLRKVCIITGKGLHSENGEGILRATAERVLSQSGLVSEKNNAPLSAGGSGALWIILKA